VEKHLAAVEGEAPGCEHRLAFLARTDPLGDAVDEQVRDVILGEIAALEGLVVLPEVGVNSHTTDPALPPLALPLYQL